MKEEVAEFAKELDVWSVPLGGVGGTSFRIQLPGPTLDGACAYKCRQIWGPLIPCQVMKRH